MSRLQEPVPGRVPMVQGTASSVGNAPSREAEYDRLADAVRASLDLAAVHRFPGLAR